MRERERDGCFLKWGEWGYLGRERGVSWLGFFLYDFFVEVFLVFYFGFVRINEKMKKKI